MQYVFVRDHHAFRISSRPRRVLEKQNVRCAVESFVRKRIDEVFRHYPTKTGNVVDVEPGCRDSASGKICLCLLYTSKQKKDGALVATIRDKLSSDANELTSTTSQNGRADRITVWTRSGGKKTANDLFAGEWTQDLSKTRLRQGMALKVEADGNDGVRFSGDFSYSARFDGKEYDLKNSRNDTVTLQLVDARTVDSIYRRDDQITQTDRWVVSADGAEMTLTTTGTLETGQQIKETLVFRKH